MSTALQLPIEGEFPSFGGATGWLNSEPLAPAELRGRAVLIQFWTFTCINWLRTLPYVRAWDQKYRADGLVVIGVHTPEFGVERDIENVRRAAQEMDIEYPIALDSDYRIWRAFDNRYWPALYFVDGDGHIRHHRFGEGEYEYSEIILQLMLASVGAADVTRDLVAVDPSGVEAAADWDELRSPETYVGYDRSENFASPGGPSPEESRTYSAPSELRLNHWALSGDWTVEDQAAVLNKAGGQIAHRFHARDLHLVMSAGERGRPARFRVLLDGEPPGAAHGLDVDEGGVGTAAEPRLYQLIRQPTPVTARTFEITFLDPEVRAYVFTFG